MSNTKIMACVGGYLTESQDGGIVVAVDAYQNKVRDLHGPSARVMLAEYANRFPNHEYINAIRYLIKNCPGVVNVQQPSP